MKSKTYDEFIEKFKQKKTTDDCYTPHSIMRVIDEYVANTYNVDEKTFIKPFKPGGDYQSEKYENKIVVDNPPFSILSKILKWYTDNDIKYFLFAPTNVCTRYTTFGCACVFVNKEITYENGARVQTAFITNLEPCCVRSDVGLSDKILKNSTARNRKKIKIRHPRLLYGFDLSNYAKIDFKIDGEKFKFLGGDFGRLLVSKDEVLHLEEIKKRVDVQKREGIIKEELNRKEQEAVENGF